MLGNFSIGDYFKKETINWAWEFVTGRLKLPRERLWVSIYLDDDESFGYWRELDVPEERILRFGEEENFWGPAGDSGPCGPSSELHYDFGEEVGCGKSTCVPGCDCGRFSEIWNLVFIQYNQDKDGKRTLLPEPNIDTGLGLERVAAVMQGKTSIYETDLLAPLLEHLSEISEKKYGVDEAADRAMRVVVEHTRGITFLISDGVVPSNEGRGYVLRRLLRRAALFGRRLGLNRPFLDEIAETIVRQMQHVYPEIGRRPGFAYEVINLEEERFGETLNIGVTLLDEIVGAAEGETEKVISGEDAFRLYDTYGFPVELTTEVAGERGFSVDLDGFEGEMEKQRERAKAAQKLSAETARIQLAPSAEPTPATDYEKLKQKSLIINLLVDNEFAETVEEGQKASVVLESAPFYAEMGGQVGDRGEIFNEKGRFLVSNTYRMPSGVVIHDGKVTEGSLTVGSEVQAEVDKERRMDTARNHTATHLLQAALRETLGEHVQQRGSLVTPDRFRFDFAHLKAMTEDEIARVEAFVNDKIRQNLPAYAEEIPYKQALEEGAIALFDEKYGDVVRAIKIGRPPISVELCGGTHVNATGEIGYFHIVGESSIGTGLRRIEALTGRGAERYIAQHLAHLEKVVGYLEAKPDAVVEKSRDIVEELRRERRLSQTMERELSKRVADSLLDRVEETKGVKVLVARVPSTRPQALRETGDFLRDKLKSAIIVLGTVQENRPLFLTVVTPDLVEKGYNAGDIVKKVAEVTGGGGGGKATMAQAGGRHKDKLDEALGLVKTLI
jgi:alanyl-tRNA synthetase